MKKFLIASVIVVLASASSVLADGSLGHDLVCVKGTVRTSHLGDPSEVLAKLRDKLSHLQEEKSALAPNSRDSIEQYQMLSQQIKDLEAFFEEVKRCSATRRLPGALR